MGYNFIDKYLKGLKRAKVASEDSNSVYNLRAVVRETGLTPDTLRVWERRYGLPQPKRTAGGHRLYSQRDIDTIKWLVAKRDAGLSISQAVSLWKQTVRHGPDPDPLKHFSPTVPRNDSDPVTFRKAWVEHCLAFDEKRGEQVLASASTLYLRALVCTEIIQRGLVEAGELWYKGEISVHQYCFLVELAVRRLETWLASVPEPTRPQRVLLGNPTQEQHTLGILLLALLLRWDGWGVVYLGGNLPLSNLADTVRRIEPTVVVLSAQQLHTAANLAEAARLLQDTGALVAYGGRIFNLLPALRQYIRGHFIGEELTAATEALDRLLRNTPPLPASQTAAQEFVLAADCYRAQEHRFEAQLHDNLKDLDINAAQVHEANEHLRRNILAALYFGDMELLSQEIFWIERLLAYHRIPVNLLYRYLNVYYRTAKTFLGGECRPIIAWLARLTGNEPS